MVGKPTLGQATKRAPHLFDRAPQTTDERTHVVSHALAIVRVEQRTRQASHEDVAVDLLRLGWLISDVLNEP